MRIDGRCLERRVTQPDLDETQIDARFQEVGGPRMTQAVDGGRFVDATVPRAALNARCTPVGHIVSQTPVSFMRLNLKRVEGKMNCSGFPARSA